MWCRYRRLHFAKYVDALLEINAALFTPNQVTPVKLGEAGEADAMRSHGLSFHDVIVITIQEKLRGDTLSRAKKFCPWYRRTWNAPRGSDGMHADIHSNLARPYSTKTPLQQGTPSQQVQHDPLPARLSSSQYNIRSAGQRINVGTCEKRDQVCFTLQFCRVSVLADVCCLLTNSDQSKGSSHAAVLAVMGLTRKPTTVLDFLKGLNLNDSDQHRLTELVQEHFYAGIGPGYDDACDEHFR